MAQQPKLEDIFNPEPQRVDITGFPYDRAQVLTSLEKSLRREPLYVGDRRKKDKGRREQSLPKHLGFNPEFIRQRQDFFRGSSEVDSLIKYKIAEDGMESMNSVYREYRRSRTRANFFDVCDVVYSTLGQLREQVAPFDSVPEAKAVLEGLDDFDAELFVMLDTLNSINWLTKFAIDMETGTFVPIEEMPDTTIQYVPNEERNRLNMDSLWEICFNLKKAAVSVREGMETNFRRRILEFIRSELLLKPDTYNLRRAYEGLAFPVRLGRTYERFMHTCESYSPPDWEDELWVERRFEEDLDTDLPGDIDEIPEAIFPEFGDHYDIRNAFPAKSLSHWRIDGRVAPINFTSKPGENKFLFAGLHSGGKSFLLDNLLLFSLIGQTGLPQPSDGMVLPLYNNFFYYRNPDTSTRGGFGKAEKEIQEIDEIRIKAGREDAIFIDEFLDSGNNEFTSSIGEGLLDRLGKSEATVFVVTHKDIDYARYRRKGWTIMSPSYSLDKRGRITLDKKLERGAPKKGIVRRFAEQRYPHLVPKRRKSTS